jgi:hypothetical protein
MEEDVMPDGQNPNHWSLNRHVQLGFIFAVAAQIIVSTWTFATMYYDVQSLKVDVARFQVDWAGLQKERSDNKSIFNQRLTVLETIMPEIRITLRDIKDQIDRNTDKLDDSIKGTRKNGGENGG